MWVNEGLKKKKVKLYPESLLRNKTAYHTHTYTSVCSLTRVDEVGLRVQQDLQRLHVVVEILEHGRAFAQDAVSREERPLLLQQQGHVVVSVARSEQHSGKKRNMKHSSDCNKIPTGAMTACSVILINH